MTQVDLDAVEAGIHHRARRPPVVGGDAGDVGLGDGVADGPEGAHVAGRGERRGSVGPGVGHRAGVAQLRGHGGTGVVHGVGDSAQARGHLVVHVDAVTVGASLGRHRQVGNRRHGGAARPHAAMEVDEGVGHLALGGGPFECRRLDEAVPQRDRPEPGRLEWRGHRVTAPVSAARLTPRWGSRIDTPRPARW